LVKDEFWFLDPLISPTPPKNSKISPFLDPGYVGFYIPKLKKFLFVGYEVMFYAQEQRTRLI
jgi:hypothetical protein